MDRLVDKIYDKISIKLTEGKKFNLIDTISLDGIPIEMLIKQYFDIHLVNCVCGFGSLLIKDKNGRYLSENDERVAPVEDVRKSILNKYPFDDWQFKIYQRGHDIQICVCIADFDMGVTEIINDFNQMGYFLSLTRTLKDKENRKWKSLQFEPLYQVSETTEILDNGDLMHLTPLYNFEKIKEEGLIPKSDNNKFSYPNRIYFFMGNIPMNQLQSVCQKLYKENRNYLNDGKFCLLKLDSKKLKQNGEINFYHDPNFSYGTFTEQPVPKEFFKSYRLINFKKDE